MKIFVIEILVYIVKAYFIYLIVSSFGLFKGIPLLYGIFISYHYLIFKVFGLSYLSFEKSLLGFGQSEQYSINLIGCFDKGIDIPKSKEYLISRTIDKIPKLHSKIVFKLFNYYWQTVEPKEAYEKIYSIELESKENLNQFIKDRIKEPIKQLNNIPYEIYLIKYINSPGGAIYLKFDHIISDGLGYVAFLCLIADNFSIDLFPKVMHIKHSYSFLIEMKDTILFPIFIFYAIYTILTLPYDKTDFKRLYNCKHTGIPNVGMSQWYSVNDMRGLRKTYGVSFNDCAVGVYLGALKQQFPSINTLNIVIPNGFTTIPRNASEVQMRNLAQGFLMGLPLITQFDQLKDIRRVIVNNVFNTNITSIPLFLFRLFGELLPVRILRIISNYIIFKTDMLISNVPGPDRELIIAGYEMTDFYPIVTNGPLKAFITIGSYNKKFRFVLSYDSSVRYNPDEAIKRIEAIMDRVHNNDYSLG